MFGFFKKAKYYGEFRQVLKALTRLPFDSIARPDPVMMHVIDACRRAQMTPAEMAIFVLLGRDVSSWLFHSTGGGESAVPKDMDERVSALMGVGAVRRDFFDDMAAPDTVLALQANRLDEAVARASGLLRTPPGKSKLERFMADIDGSSDYGREEPRLGS